jgi:uncharacterized protein
VKQKHIIFLHGFLSSGQSGKANFMQEQFKSNLTIQLHAFDFNPTRRDFEFMTVTGMINRLRQYVLSNELNKISLIGSSMGGLVGLHYARQYGNVENLLLLAPALSYFIDNREEAEARRANPEEIRLIDHYAYGEKLPLRAAIDVDGLLYRHQIEPPMPLVIIHGRFDDVVPLKHSQEYQAKYPGTVHLIEVNSDHRLQDQHDRIWSQITKF